MALRIRVSRHSIFYSPLISTLAGGFLKEQGLDGAYSILAHGERSHVLLRDGVVDIMQSAVATNWKPMEQGEANLPLHFAQINRRDGFFLAGRAPEPSFEWKNLQGKTLVADHGGQPMTMLRYAASEQKVDWPSVRLIDAGTPDEMLEAFRKGAGDYVHLQGPGPQRLAHDKDGYIVTAVGEAMPPVAFSSLCASREFVASEDCRAFVRAFTRAKEWVRQAPPGEVAAKQASFFPEIDPAILAATVERYQKLGCWDGGVEIPRDLYEQALNVFERSGDVGARHPYEDVCTVVST